MKRKIKPSEIKAQFKKKGNTKNIFQSKRYINALVPNSIAIIIHYTGITIIYIPWI